MDSILTFIATMTGHLAWPLSLLILILAFRNRLTPLLQKLSKFEAGTDGLSFEFHQKLQAVAKRVEKGTEHKGILQETSAPAIAGPSTMGLKELLDLAKRHPIAAVTEAWRSLEAVVLAAAPGVAPAVSRGEAAIPTVQIAVQSGVSKDVLDVLVDLRALRNKAAHAAVGMVSSEEAANYVHLAARTAAEVRTQLER